MYKQNEEQKLVFGIHISLYFEYKLLQSCWEINNENRDRDLRGIQNAIKNTSAAKAAINTYDQEDRLDGIDLIPVWKWI